MRNIPFNVSARTARLIGRENVSSAEGAIIELVKNSYDADARFCVVYFEDEFLDLPVSLGTESFEKLSGLLSTGGYESILGYYSFDATVDLYCFDLKSYIESVDEEFRAAVESYLQRSVNIHILDDGDGMTEEVIEKSWMTIGTNNKHIDFRSTKGRVKSGAKGIGRFALDRLGEGCDLLTKSKFSDSTLNWIVNWGDFDRQGVTIDGVSAQLGFSPKKLDKNPLLLDFSKVCSDYDFSVRATGVQLKISDVRDVWRQEAISKVFQELESLVPPVEAGGFEVFVFSQRYSGSFGQVVSSVCDDYDYKLSVQMDEQGALRFDVVRNEIDKTRISAELLSRPFFDDVTYSKARLIGEKWESHQTLYELMPGLKKTNPNAHLMIGAFKFDLYFLKRISSKKDTEIFLHRPFNVESRKKWLDNNNGVRIYRDNFRVRPYGEIGKASWDWLGLGRRKAEDPSALRTGRWKVNPSAIAGVIHISRISNIGLEDKSSREGIQENDAYRLFCTVILNVIKFFENDRSALYREIYRFYEEGKDVPSDDHITPKQEEDAERIAHKIFNEIKAETAEPQEDSVKLALALLKQKARNREADDRLEDMRKENSLLRVFASSGVTIASFTHELDNLNAKLGGRFDSLETIVRAYSEMAVDARLSLRPFQDPFHRIQMFRRDDEKVKNWIKYSLRTIRKDKRKRVDINIKPYLENLRDEWNYTLEERQVVLNVSVPDPSLVLRAYEIDLDCIFNNLIINSADAFKRPGFFGDRNIDIHAERVNGKLKISYRDSGPGLDGDIVNPGDIFKPTFTTKKNIAGEETGTGLGMWLLQITLEEYGGAASIEVGSGFNLKMEI